MPCCTACADGLKHAVSKPNAWDAWLKRVWLGTFSWWKLLNFDHADFILMLFAQSNHMYRTLCVGGNLASCHQHITSMYQVSEQTHIGLVLDLGHNIQVLLMCWFSLTLFLSPSVALYKVYVGIIWASISWMFQPFLPGTGWPFFWSCVLCIHGLCPCPLSGRNNKCTLFSLSSSAQMTVARHEDFVSSCCFAGSRQEVCWNRVLDCHSMRCFNLPSASCVLMLVLASAVALRESYQCLF